jgi:hypothetical protein
VAGAIAPALGPVVEEATRRLADHTHPPVPTIVASDLGADVVRTGALRRALGIVRDDPLRFLLTPPRRPSTGPASSG